MMNRMKHSGRTAGRQAFPAGRRSPDRWRSRSGVTLVELLVVSVIAACAALYIGQGFARLSALEELNREKAVTLGKLCDHYARTQPLVAVGAGVLATTATNVSVAYPDIVFGIANEKENFVQVTNSVIMTGQDGVLRTVVEAGRITGSKGTTNSMDWLHTVFGRGAQPTHTESSATQTAPDIVQLRYACRIGIGDALAEVQFAAPVKLRNRQP
jgi:prepilin-type N-terminal cleavage/methylation domain-containing protein